MQYVQSITKSLKKLSVSTTLLLGLTAISVISIVGKLINYSNYGIDFTDESYYLVWIKNPFLYNWSLSQFGFIYNPLYEVLNENIPELRQTNIAIVFMLSWILINTLLCKSTKNLLTSSIYRHAVSAGFATSSLIYFRNFLLTPSYNSLNFQSLLIVSIGLLLAEKNHTKKSIIGWILLGFGGWLTFMAKISTTLPLIALVIFYIVLSGKLYIRMLVIAAVTALILLIISALSIDGSIYKFIDRLQTAMNFVGYLDAGHSLKDLVRIDEFQLNLREMVAIFSLAVSSFFAVWALKSKKIILKSSALIISIFYIFLIISIIFEITNKRTGFGQFRGLIIWGIVFSSIALSVVTLQKNIFLAITRSEWAAALSFLAMPHIYAFGTNNNYWQSGSAVAIFWLLAGLVLLGPVARIKNGWRFALPLALAVPAATASILQTGFEKPYRQPQPLRLNNTIVDFGSSASPLVLPKEYARYIEDAVDGTHNVGFLPGTSVIDLTGQSPGILYAIGAENIAQAWTIGGYPGSQKLAEAAFGRVSCNHLAHAWVLAEPGGPRSIPPDTVGAYGANLFSDFKPVAAWHTAKGAGGFTKARQQILYRPLQPATVLEACESIRDRGEP